MNPRYLSGMSQEKMRWESTNTKRFHPPKKKKNSRNLTPLQICPAVFPIFFWNYLLRFAIGQLTLKQKQVDVWPWDFQTIRAGGIYKGSDIYIILHLFTSSNIWPNYQQIHTLNLYRSSPAVSNRIHWIDLDIYFQWHVQPVEWSSWALGQHSRWLTQVGIIKTVLVAPVPKFCDMILQTIIWGKDMSCLVYLHATLHILPQCHG